MFGVATPTRAPISATTATSASISSGRPASASCSIDVLKLPSWRVTAMRSSPDCAIGQPIRAPTAAASAIARSMNACTSGSSRIRSVVAPVSAEIGLVVMLPHNLYQMSRADVGARLGREAGLRERRADFVVRAEAPPRGSPTISRLPKPCWMTPGAGLEQLRWTTQPSTWSSGNAAAMAPSGSTLASDASRSARRSPSGPARRNHHGTPFIAGRMAVRLSSIGAKRRRDVDQAPGPSGPARRDPAGRGRAGRRWR